MNGKHNEIVLEGCAPVPLAHYLKALGILRLVSEQTDSEARGYWKNDAFVLRTRLSREELGDFFLIDYEPTPIVAPWNGRGGFLEGEGESNRAGGKMIHTFNDAKTIRFSSYKKVIDVLNQNITLMNMNKTRSKKKEYDKRKNELKKMSGSLTEDNKVELNSLNEMVKSEADREKELKSQLLFSLRATIPDIGLNWMDACLVLSENYDQSPSMIPLLGTGGVDGSQDFSLNFMQRLCEMIDPATGALTGNSAAYLNHSLFASSVNNLVNKTIGQFFPTAVGGANATAGFESDSLMNPWDYILMLEGALLFATASVKKLENHEGGTMSAPFSVRQVGVGYGSSSQDDEKASRAEIWVPLWDRPTTYRELSLVMSEGRASIKKRPARNGIDFARAIASLGVDRGLTAFQRYGFLMRNGKNYFAIPLDRFQVKRQFQVDLLYEIDNWLNIFKGKATSDKAPVSAGRALRNLENSILSLCKSRGPSRVQEVLISLGNCEKAMAMSTKWTMEVAYLKPVPPLSPRWLKEADDGSPEFRLAASLASVYGKYKNREGKTVFISVRSQLEPVTSSVKDGKTGKIWWNREANRDVVRSEGDLIKTLNAIMSRRIMKAQQSGATSFPDHGNLWSEPGDVSDFIEGRLDMDRISNILWGLLLIDWPAVKGVFIKTRSRGTNLFSGATYALLKLCFAGGKVEGVEIPLSPQIHRRAMNGDSVQATKLASRRLRGSGLVPAIQVNVSSNETMQRIAAALIFPINDYQRNNLVGIVCRPQGNFGEQTEQ